MSYRRSLPTANGTVACHGNGSSTALAASDAAGLGAQPGGPAWNGRERADTNPEAAPNAAQRFVELVESGFYDQTPISRVVPGFVAQFGINWREPHKQWENNEFNDDPTRFALDRGTLAFAKAGPNTNSTQVFINYVNNNRLADPQSNFTVFGKVVEGMDVVDAFTQVGEPGGGLDQERLWMDGDAYLAELATKPTMIERAVLQD